MTDFFEEMKWRGMIHDMMPGAEDQLKKEMTTAYIGFDPTADSLHIGSLVQIMILVHFQKAGHSHVDRVHLQAAYASCRAQNLSSLFLSILPLV